MLVIDHDHRQIAVGQTIGDASGETDDLLAAQCDGSALRVFDQLSEVIAGACSVPPAMLAEEQPYRLHFVR